MALLLWNYSLLIKTEGTFTAFNSSPHISCFLLSFRDKYFYFAKPLLLNIDLSSLIMFACWRVLLLLMRNPSRCFLVMVLHIEYDISQHLSVRKFVFFKAYHTLGWTNCITWKWLSDALFSLACQNGFGDGRKNNDM